VRACVRVCASYWCSPADNNLRPAVPLKPFSHTDGAHRLVDRSRNKEIILEVQFVYVSTHNYFAAAAKPMRFTALLIFIAARDNEALIIIT